MADIYENPVIKALIERRTVRSYTEEKLTEEEISAILKCAMLSPSARNAQHCVVRVVTCKEKLDELNADFKNKVGWDTPAYTRWDVNPVYHGAPAVFFIYADTEAYIDAGIMAENIATAAKGINLDSCIIGSIGTLLADESETKWKALMKLESNMKFMLAVAVGHGNENPEVKPRNEKEFFTVL